MARFLTAHRPALVRSLYHSLWGILVSLCVALILVAPARAQDIPTTAHLQPPASSSLPAGWNIVNQDDGYTRWRLQVDSACIFTDHRYSFNLPEDPERMSDIRLTMSNFDVDYFDPQDCEGGPEFDNADLNGQTLGILAGANEQWSVNSWELTRERLKKGVNNIFIDTDATGSGCWCVAVGYIELRAKVGFHILDTTPPNNDQNRDFHAAKLDLTVTFSGDLDPATVNQNTFILHTRNSAGQPQVVNGTFSFPAPNKFLFTPSADLLDGVRYYATVIGGPTGVKNQSGVPLDLTRTWSFWTVPDLARTDSFDYGTGEGSRCSPSVSPCPGLEIAVFQAVRNATMVPNKDSVARLYLRWRRHSGVHPDDQLKSLTVNVTLNVAPGGGSYSAIQTVKRPDQYSPAEIGSAANTINIYHKPPSGFNYSATVTPQPQSNAIPVVFNATRPLPNLGKSPTVTFRHYFLKDGAWIDGVPNDIKSGAATYLTTGALRTLDMFPAVAVTPDIQGDVTIGYAYTGNNVPYGSCGTVKEVMCRIGLVDVRMPEAKCVYEKLSTMLGGNKIVSISVPQNVCTNSGGVAIGRVLMLVPTNNPVVVPHEVGHAYDISTANNPNDGHRNDPTGIEGFQVRTRLNRSRAENPGVAESLMHTGPVASPDSQWIHNDDYDTLLGTVTAAQAAIAQANSYLLVAGVVDIAENRADVDPLVLQDSPLDAEATGLCRAELLDGASALLADAPFTPGVEVHTYLPPGATQTYIYSPANPDQGGPQPFAVTLPWSEAAQSLRITCGGPPLFTLSRSALAPSVDFVDLADGTTLSDEVAINWSGSDGDSATLFYQLHFSTDQGASWSPLTPATTATTYVLDTIVLPSGGDHKLRVLVTDGFNSTLATRTVTLANPLMVIGAVPEDFSDDLPLGATIQAVFNTPLDPQTLSIQSFTVEGPTNPVTTTGSLTLSADGRTVTFQPAALLAADRYYTVRVRDTLRDVTGSSLPFGHVWSFRTVSDTVPPLIEFHAPAAGETNVPLNAFVSLRFNEPLAFGLAQANFSLVDDQDQPVAGFTSTYDNERIILFDPEADLKPNTHYKATLATGITDANNNPLARPHTWSFTTGDDVVPHAHIIGNYNEQVQDVDGDGLYDILTIFVDVQSLSGPYFLNARLIDHTGELIQWTTADFGRGGFFPNLLDQGVHRLALTFDARAIRAHQVDGPYFLDALNFYGGFFNLTGEGDHRYRVYQTLPYRFTDFAGILSFKPLPDRRLPWNSTLEDAWNLRDYIVSLATSPDEVTYHIIGNTDPRVGVSIDANDFIDIKPAPGVEAESTITVEARDSAGNRGQGTFEVYVQKPEATLLAFAPTLALFVNQDQTITIEIQDQFETLFTGEAVTVTISNELESATITPESVTTSNGRATFTYSPGARSGTDILTVDAGSGLSATIYIAIGKEVIFLPTLHNPFINAP